ncbi:MULTISPECIES: fimbrial protein [unclassified Escherichia]|uniref:fimbrial protein n=1 Tax=unclassified Escherichia TaxID=2608889 RepID=UPI00107F3040|nr:MULTISPECIES: fimbrial protein [unclassified Escherichia]TGC20553.1 fimbrial protein [Escherichia sp. E2562]TGC29651.1 fimbrial protein [Escherichia sp. E1130]TLI74659.1 fimbrial protein [Escherichia sp. E1130]TLI84661.1 fimbrial protein [Escherichia sp. E2562]
MRRILKTSVLIGFGLPTISFAADGLDVDFTANILATTCTITIVQDGGPKVNADGGDNYSLTIASVGLDKIVTGNTLAQANFKLVASGCSSGYQKIYTKLSGASISGKLIKNEATTSAAANIGMGIKLRDTADSAFITPNNTFSIEWSADNKANGLPLTVALRETTAGMGNTGTFRAKATFNFTYE